MKKCKNVKYKNVKMQNCRNVFIYLFVSFTKKHYIAVIM